jgi:predicted CXXCH cytochrome family protein
VEHQDCDRCHDPHRGDNWQFTPGDIPASYRGANVCSLCHGTGGHSHPIDVLTDLPQDRTWDPYASTPDFSGTQIWDSAGAQEIPTGTAYIKCETCHMSHGAVPDTDLNSMAYSDAESSNSPICVNCHP